MTDEKKHMPRWAKRLLLIVSIVGPLCGATVTIVSSIIDIRSKARDASAKTKASYETLAPAVKELQDLLSDTQDIVEADEREIAELKSVRDAQERRLIRLEAYVDLLGRRGNLPAPPPEVEAPVKIPVTSSKIKKLKPAKPVLSDVRGAYQYQQVKADLGCGPEDPICEDKAADLAAPNDEK